MTTIHCHKREIQAGLTLANIPLSSLHISIQEAYNMVNMWSEEFGMGELVVECTNFSRTVGDLLNSKWLCSETGVSSSKDDRLLIPSSEEGNIPLHSACMLTDWVGLCNSGMVYI